MTAEVHARINGDGEIELDAAGEARDQLTLLAAFADALASSTNSRPSDVLKRAESRVASMHRRGEHRLVITQEAGD